MPTYEYACATCGHQWEEIQKISEPPVESCPHCKNMSAKRQISGGSFILKGGGWYADLYSSSSSKSSSKGDSGSSSSSSSSNTSTPSTSPSTPPSTTPDKKSDSKSAA